MKRKFHVPVLRRGGGSNLSFLFGRASKHKKESIITGHLKKMLRREQ
jgi:hypothetical protein